MANYARLLLSASTNGAPVKIAATAIATGTLLHTAINGSALQFDEVYIWVANTDTVDHTVTVGWGGVTDPDNITTKNYTIPANSPPIPILTGQVLNGGLPVKMAADVANVLTAFGFCNRIS